MMRSSISSARNYGGTVTCAPRTNAAGTARGLFGRGGTAARGCTIHFLRPASGRNKRSLGQCCAAYVL
eukprot:422251-Lingulodinium_polyedra.AAC.1